ncbi:MAG TPA: FAD-binding protein [Candidatus Corynebacterium intestinavium]|uniref:L-aspartate oxidase n=1 Tax=Candidatus Corynebacterium intestinavium TaxID=2838531 RepID=A0A9D2UCL3_9CORY|nr:FAD-binding protein [Candidatus Corynebacterium intestinavium]
MPQVNVLGSGVAGMVAALTAAAAGAEVALIYPGASIAGSRGATQLAQGGIAAAIDPADSVAAHVKDTLAAGAELVAPGSEEARAVEFLAAEGAVAVRRLLAAGFPADLLPDGTPALALEAAHSAERIVHAWGDRTGAALHAFLAEQVEASTGEHSGGLQGGAITLHPGCELAELLLTDGVVTGARVRRAGDTVNLSADATIVATGGYSGIFPRSTSGGVCTGAGIFAAARAGAVLADMEFVQFHPTVLAGTNFLISEAVRGAGGVLLDDAGQRFLKNVDPRAELAPRDVVASGVCRALHEHTDNVWLDARHIPQLTEEFPGITAMLASQGIDWRHELVPVAPAAHYCMGGIATDLHGCTSVPGLYAAGEAARTGVHGANRLASNSLLEALVFAAAAGKDAATQLSGNQGQQPTGLATATAEGRVLDVELPLPEGAAPGVTSPANVEESNAAARDDAATQADSAAQGDSAARDAVGEGLDVERTGDGIRQARQRLAEVPGTIATVAQLVATAAEARTESRGAHRRRDYPRTDGNQASSRFLRLVPGGT